MSAKSELREIKNELSSIIQELESISNGIRKNFVGIGNERCADCIDSVIDQYKYVKRKLNNIEIPPETDSGSNGKSGGGGK